MKNVIEKINQAIKDNAKELNLRFLDIVNLPRSICELTQLESINLWNNKITQFPLELFELPNLKIIDLSQNSIQNIPDEFHKLRDLEYLNLGSNCIKKVEVNFNENTKLIILNLSNNKISQIDNCITDIANLEKLDFSSNIVKKVSTKISSLSHLSILNLLNNDLKTLPDEIGDLRNLNELNIEGNKISVIPKSLKKLENLSFFGITNNPIGDCPAPIVSQGVKARINYYTSRGDDIKLYEAKLILVGNGRVGKSWIANRLLWDAIDTSKISTYGIDINSWNTSTHKSKKFQINLWDFGGQEIYHSTHQFFLTERALYLFIWEASSDNYYLGFDYWLNTISLLSKNSIVLVIQNKIDERTYFLDQNTYKENFPDIIGFHNVSAKTGEGFKELKNTILSEINELEHIGDELPGVWLKIRTFLTNSDKSFIEYQEYIDICFNYGLDTMQASYLSRYFNDIGVFLHFRDDALLKNILFLKPEWATEAVYTLIDSETVKAQYGIFDYSDLSSLWESYPIDKYVYLIELMKKFELCFKIPGKESYIVPELLVKKNFEFEWDYSDNLKFTYRYEFMPAGLITRFIVRANDLISEGDFWKYGLIIKIDNAKALIKSDYIKRIIEINLVGVDKKILLEIIRREFSIIHTSLKNPKYTEQLSCNCHECYNSSNPYLFDYYRLQKARIKGVIDIQCPDSFAQVDVETLFSQIQDKISHKDSIELVKHKLPSVEHINYKKDKEAVSEIVIRGDIFKLDEPLAQSQLKTLISALIDMYITENVDFINLLSGFYKVDNLKRKEELGEEFKSFLINHGAPLLEPVSSSTLFNLGRKVIT